jgi:hypothetical protein
VRYHPRHVLHRTPYATAFYEIAASGSAPIAAEALARIAEFYAIEVDIRGRSADERRSSTA